MVMRILLIAAVIAAVAISARTVAGFYDSADASPVSAIVRSRQGNFKSLLRLDRSIGIAMRQSPPDAVAVSRAATAASRLALQIPSWFPAGSGPDQNSRTYARREIWTDSAAFRVRAKTLADVLGELNRAARSGNVGQMRAMQVRIGPACKDCHQAFAARL